MTKKHQHCEACSHDHGDHDPSHDKYNQLVEYLGFSLEGNVAIQVLDALETQSDKAFAAMLTAMIDNPLAFIDALHISTDE